MPRGRLAYEPSYRVVACPLSGMCTSTRARNSSGSSVSVPAVSVPAVGPVRHGLRGSVVGQALQRDGIPGAVACEPHRERAIVLGDPKGSSQTAVCT
jgi:hypothetical protein